MYGPYYCQNASLESNSNSLDSIVFFEVVISAVWPSPTRSLLGYACCVDWSSCTSMIHIAMFKSVYRMEIVSFRLQTVYDDFCNPGGTQNVTLLSDENICPILWIKIIGFTICQENVRSPNIFCPDDNLFDSSVHFRIPCHEIITPAVTQHNWSGIHGQKLLGLGPSDSVLVLGPRKF